MPAIEKGRKCIVKKGNLMGQQVQITEIIDENFVKIKDAKGKEQRMSIKHLEPLA